MLYRDIQIFNNFCIKASSIQNNNYSKERIPLEYRNM